MSSETRSEKRCLVLTATIKPNAIYSVHTDVEARALEYLEAIRFYRANFSGDIFLLENSEYDIWNDARFAELHETKVICIVKMPPSDQFDKGKGYQEFKMLDEFVLQYSNTYKTFFKITGRYILKNFRKLQKAKCKGIVIDRYPKLKIAITSHFLCDFNFYLTHFMGAYKDVNDKEGIYIEKVLYKILKSISPAGAGMSFFSANPRLLGVSGSTGRSLTESYYKDLIRDISRPILKLLNIKELL